MGKRVKKLPMATVVGSFELEIADRDWRRIETAYGRPLSADLRDKIFLLTQSFINFAPFEQSAEPLKLARDRAEAWRRTAEGLRQELFSGSQSDAYVFAQSQVTRIFADQNLFHNLAGILTSFAVACQQAIDFMEDPALPDHREGEKWEKWVISLRTALREAGHPTGARKDSGDLGKESPFTMFVSELQKCVPETIQRYTKSTSGLASAIYRISQS